MARHSCDAVSVGEIAAALAGAATVSGDPDTVVQGITQDSRSVLPGDLYCCVVGRTHDGHSFVPEARSRGAAAVLCQRGIPIGDDVPVRLEVDDVRDVLGRVAGRVFGSPASRLRMIGVTGTNGKTSTVEIIGSILGAAGHSVRTMGTLTGQRTTPEAIDLHAALAAAIGDGVDTVVMEVSSHALDQRRVDGVCFEVAVFTNLGRDHLDYHGTMEAYFAAKARLFGPDLCRSAVVNLDDTHGRLLMDSARVPTRGCSRADARDVHVGLDRVSFRWRGATVEVPVGGDFMVDNALAAATAAEVLGVPVEHVVEGCAALGTIKGRFESVVSADGRAVVVDYAHTPEALERLLRSVRQLASGRVIVVFGCGGDRDKGKRPLMGRVAAELADAVVVTSDNPRHEDPMSIIEDVLAGVPDRRSGITVEPDRESAITAGVSMAARGDVVVIAGKGHETVQESGGQCVHFDDLEIASSRLVGRGSDGDNEGGNGA